jgi:hypothetical protein
MYFFWIKKTIKSKKMTVKEGEVYLLPEKEAMPLAAGLRLVGFNEHFRMIKLADVLAPYQYGDIENIMMMKPGAIGDIIALSALRFILPKKHIIFITNEISYPIFDWWQYPPNLIRTYQGSIFEKVDAEELVSILKYTRGFMYRGEIENGSPKNWYEIIFSTIGIDNPLPEFCRPCLRQDRINSLPSNIQKIMGEFEPRLKSILLCPRATSNMRSMSLENLYNAIRPNAPEDMLFIHEKNLTNRDRVFIHLKKDYRLCVINAKNMAAFFLDCYDADQVISTDTAHLHFREGIGKPAIGIYSAFTSESRCKYYKYVKTIDIKSPCKLQPCFLHSNKEPDTCSVQKDNELNDSEAPCLSSVFNPDLNSQLSNAFSKLLNQAK